MEEKKYDVQGTVTISTEEYRDLIVSAIEQGKEADKYRSQYWDEVNKRSELETKLKASEERCDTYKKFINADEERFKDYKFWLAQRIPVNEDED